MKIRIISDIHTDINENQNYQFDFGDDFVVICGDISGDRCTTENWINEYIAKGVFVAGNHLGYNQVTYDENDTKESSIEYLRKKFNGAICFLEDDIYVVDDIVFVGSCLYSDFELYNKYVYCMSLASNSLNDFRCIKVKDKDTVRRLHPIDTVEWHKKSVQFIDEACKKYSNKKIIVVSHYAPSKDCVSDEHKNDMLSAAFASNLDWLMKEHDNLVLWCHGHMHSDVDFIKYGTRVVCHPWGYYSENNKDAKNYGFIIDTDNL